MVPTVRSTLRAFIEKTGLIRDEVYSRLLRQIVQPSQRQATQASAATKARANRTEAQTGSHKLNNSIKPPITTAQSKCLARSTTSRNIRIPPHTNLFCIHWLQSGHREKVG
jgi:hypothetical protein